MRPKNPVLFARHVACAGLSALLIAPTMVRAEWTTTQGISYHCAGVGLESRTEMASSAEGNAKITLTAGQERGYLSDVQLTVSGGDLSQPASWQSAGPICLLKLPAGQYKVNATFEGQQRQGSLNVPAAPSSNPPSLLFNFPAD